MKKIILSLFLLAGLIVTGLVVHVHAQGKVIVLDPGHGGSDPGAVYQDLQEKDVNLDIAQRTKSVLEEAGYTVYLTRTDDSTKSNNDRYTFANSVGGSALVSIHLNASSNHEIDYTRSFFGKKRKDLGLTQAVHGSLAGNLGINDGGIGQYASGVLLKSKMPATLAETVFLSSEYEYNLLTNGTGERQQQIAEALAQGIENFVK